MDRSRGSGQEIVVLSCPVAFPVSMAVPTPPADVSLPPAGRGDAIAAGGSHLGGAARRAHGEDRFKGVAANFSSPPFFRRSTRGSLFALVCLGIRSMGPGGGDSSGIRKERDQPDPPFPYWLILPPSSPKVTAASAEHYD